MTRANINGVVQYYQPIETMLKDIKKVRKLIVTEAIQKYNTFEYVQVEDGVYLVGSDIVNDEKIIYMVIYDDFEISFARLMIPDEYNDQIVESDMGIDEITDVIEIEAITKGTDLISELSSYEIQNTNLGNAHTFTLLNTIFNIINEQKDDYLFFTADLDETNRVSLYDLFSKITNKSFGFESIDTFTSESEDVDEKAINIVGDIDDGYKYYVFKRI